MKLTIDENETIITWLRGQTNPPGKRMRARVRIQFQQARCHPDLMGRLEAIAEGLTTSTRFLANIPVLVHPNRVIFAVAEGTTWMALRLPAHGHSAVNHGEWGPRGLGGEWTDADPWLSELPSPEGISRLQGLCRAAYAHAAELR